MKKKLLAAVCAAAVFLTGCGPTISLKKTESETKAAETQAQAETEEETTEAEAGPLFVYEDEKFYFEITQVFPDAADGYQMDVIMENRDVENEVNACMQDLSVQGYVTTAFYDYIYENGMGSKGGTITLAASERKEFTIYADWEDLKPWGIETVDEIDFNLRTWNRDVWEDDCLYQHCTVYPTGLTAESVVYPERPFEQEQIILDNEAVQPVFYGVTEKEDGTPVLNFWAESRLDSEATFEIQDVALNGGAANESTFYVFYLNGGKRTVAPFEQRDCGYSRYEINNVSLNLYIYHGGEEMNYPVEFSLLEEIRE